jgi:hypothetical protein
VLESFFGLAVMGDLLVAGHIIESLLPA